MYDNVTKFNSLLGQPMLCQNENIARSTLGILGGLVLLVPLPRKCNKCCLTVGFHCPVM